MAALKARLKEFNSHRQEHTLNLAIALQRIPQLQFMSPYIQNADFLSILECLGSALRIGDEVVRNNVQHNHLIDEGYVEEMEEEEEDNL